MKKTNFVCTALLLALSCGAYAGEFKDKGEIIAVDFPAGWAPGKSDDPTVALKLSRGKAFFEFSRQDSELSDYYLKARVKEQVDSLRGKGTSLSGDIKPVSLHGVSNAYYTTYDSMGSAGYMAFFTYNGVSYAVSASGLDESDFRGVILSVRKPGEKIEMPKPKRVRVVRRAKKEKMEGEESGTQIFKDGEPDASTAAVGNLAAVGSPVAVGSPATAEAAAVPTEAPVAAATQPAAGEAAQNFLASLSKKDETGLPPYLPRKPLPFVLWGALIALWVGGSFAARAAAAGYKNPKLPPPPADVPPDFFFPFMISKVSSLKDVTYNIVTRQRQLLLADYPCEHELYLAGGIYGAIFFHIAWSLLAFVGRGDLFTNILLHVPLLGRALASLPEIFFIVPVIAGAAMYFSKQRSLQVYDAQSALLMEVKPEIVYGLIRDGGGKEVARLVRKGGFMDRSWEFVDTDNSVVLTIRDDFPKGHLLRMLFGSLGGSLRARYGLFHQERRAGYVFLDPSSADRFQIHMDYAFARMGHPAQILAAVLYITSKEKDAIYPSPF